jgi:hypothetical protein
MVASGEHEGPDDGRNGERRERRFLKKTHFGMPFKRGLQDPGMIGDASFARLESG